MSVSVTLIHHSSYDYERPVNVSTQTLRLRPESSVRTPILGYRLEVRPEEHIVTWYKDSFGNAVAQITVLEKTQKLELAVRLDVELRPHNPFEFALQGDARRWPFGYDESSANLWIYLSPSTASSVFFQFVSRVDQTPRSTLDFVAHLNQLTHATLKYIERDEPGVQSPEQTLTLGSGSCRDSAWLLVHLCRHFGLAARFVSGYLVELAPSEAMPHGRHEDSLALHAWADVFLPGAGWIGLDATSGLFATEGHIPLAVAPDPAGAAPIEGFVEKSDVSFAFEMKVERGHAPS